MPSACYTGYSTKIEPITRYRGPVDTRTASTSAREQTRAALLRLIREGRASTRAELVARTGYSRSTVGHAVTQLLAAGLVEEAEQTAKGPGSGRGRPGYVLRPVGTDAYVGAIDIGHQHIAVAVGDSLGRSLGEARADAPADAEGKLDAAAAALASLCDSLSISRLDFVCAGIPKPVNLLTGTIDAPRVGDGWAGLNPAHEIGRRLQVPAHAVNDTTLGARGERVAGAARGIDDFLFITASHGIGASLYLNGRPYDGVNGLVGNIAHCRIDGRVELCRCGRRGCLEAVASLPAVRLQISETRPGSDPDTVMADDDDTAHRILAEAGRALGGVVADFCNLLTPARVVIGGALGAGFPAYLSGVAWAVDEYGSSAVASTTTVVASTLGERSELVGGLDLAAELAAAPVAASR